MTPFQKALVVLALPVATAMAYFVWPTPWRYDHVKMSEKTLPVRVHRVTDKTEILYGGDGWEPVGPHAQATESPLVQLPSGELSAIQGTMEITNYGYLIFDLHNGTQRDLKELHVEVFIGPTKNVEVTRREYRLPVYVGRPLSAFDVKAPCGCQMRAGETYKWRIVGAKGAGGGDSKPWDRDWSQFEPIGKSASPPVK